MPKATAGQAHKTGTQDAVFGQSAVLTGHTGSSAGFQMAACMGTSALPTSSLLLGQPNLDLMQAIDT